MNDEQRLIAIHEIEVNPERAFRALCAGARIIERQAEHIADLQAVVRKFSDACEELDHAAGTWRDLYYRAKGVYIAVWVNSTLDIVNETARLMCVCGDSFTTESAMSDHFRHHANIG